MKLTTTNILFFTLLLSLLVFNVIQKFSLNESKKRNKVLDNHIEVQKELRKNLLNKPIKLIKLQLQIEKSLSRIKCDSILQGERKIFFLFMNPDCKQCVLHMLMDANVLSEQIGKKRIVIVGNINNEAELTDYIRNFNLDYNSIIFKNIVNIDPKVINVNLLAFIIDENFNIRFLFDFQNNNMALSSNEYFSTLLTYYFNNY